MPRTSEPRTSEPGEYDCPRDDPDFVAEMEAWEDEAFGDEKRAFFESYANAVRERFDD